MLTYFFGDGIWGQGEKVLGLKVGVQELVLYGCVGISSFDCIYSL